VSRAPTLGTATAVVAAKAPALATTAAAVFTTAAAAVVTAAAVAAVAAAAAGGVLSQLAARAPLRDDGPRAVERRKLHFGKGQILKPGFHLIGARVETTWVPGAFQLWS
jgi:hypothetical protein